MTNAQPPDVMKKLVLLIIGIAILGTVIALGVHYGVELPAQKTIQAPSNDGDSSPPGNFWLTPTCDEKWPGRCSGLPKPG